MKEKGMTRKLGWFQERQIHDNKFLNYIIQREKENEKGERKVYRYIMFVDVKAIDEMQTAFDNVDRKKLWKIIGEKGVDSKLTNRTKKIYEDTEVIIKTKED